VVVGGVTLGALCLFGGEYGTLDWLKLRAQLASERAAIRELAAALDTPARIARELETDPVRIESLTLVEIVDTQRHLSESPDSRRHYRLRSGRAEPRL
jgi:hypothetical protein